MQYDACFYLYTTPKLPFIIEIISFSILIKFLSARKEKKRKKELKEKTFRKITNGCCYNMKNAKKINTEKYIIYKKLYK